MIKPSPAFQFYPSDFLSDENVAIMSNREVGCYIKLICYCWKQGSIPNDTKRIALLCQENGKAMAKLWQNIEGCFRSKGDRLIHPRLDRERIKQEKHRKGRSEAGKKGAEIRWENERLNSKAMAKLWQKNGTAKDLPMAKNGSSSSSISSPSSSKEKPAKKRRNFESKISKKYVDEINKHCEVLYRYSKFSKNGLKFNGHQFVQKCTNENIHPLAIIDGLTGTIKKWHDRKDPMRNPYTYANGIVKTTSGNYHEKDHLAESKEFKNVWDDIVQSGKLKKLVDGIGG